MSAWTAPTPQPMCDHLTDQSPIDIGGESVIVDDKLSQLAWRSSEGTGQGESQLRIDLYTWDVHVLEGEESVTWKGKQYELQSIHFHSPSENTMDGLHWPMEAQMVHTSSDGQHLVVAQMLSVNEHDNVFLSKTWSSSRCEDGEIRSPHVTTKTAYTELLMLDGMYYTWMGSLTTPPCTNNTVWILMQKTAMISRMQLEAYRRHINSVLEDQLAEARARPRGLPDMWDMTLGSNNRPTQPLGTRIVSLFIPNSSNASVPQQPEHQSVTAGPTGATAATTTTTATATTMFTTASTERPSDTVVHGTSTTATYPPTAVNVTTVTMSAASDTFAAEAEGNGSRTKTTTKIPSIATTMSRMIGAAPRAAEEIGTMTLTSTTQLGTRSAMATRTSTTMTATKTETTKSTATTVTMSVAMNKVAGESEANGSTVITTRTPSTTATSSTTTVEGAAGSAGATGTAITATTTIAAATSEAEFSTRRGTTTTNTTQSTTTTNAIMTATTRTLGAEEVAMATGKTTTSTTQPPSMSTVAMTSATVPKTSTGASGLATPTRANTITKTILTKITITTPIATTVVTTATTTTGELVVNGLTTATAASATTTTVTATMTSVDTIAAATARTTTTDVAAIAGDSTGRPTTTGVQRGRQKVKSMSKAQFALKPLPEVAVEDAQRLRLAVAQEVAQKQHQKARKARKETETIERVWDGKQDVAKRDNNVVAWKWRPPTAMCGHIGDQSPIDVSRKYVAYDNDLSSLHSEYNASVAQEGTEQMTDLNSWDIEFSKGVGKVVLEKKNYELTSIRFHSPSENTVDGLYFPLEAQMMHMADDGQFLVVSQLLNVTEVDNDFLSKLWRLYPSDGDARPFRNAGDPYSGLLSSNGSYYSWLGSLTTSPCTNNTIWMLMQEPMMMSQVQLRAFREHINTMIGKELFKLTAVPRGLPDSWNMTLGVNSRPTQPLLGRVVQGFVPGA
eukprot:TRINITY_DN244_c0_g3_i1.p1 TRINITY_DN244_c0_g3~~TRINITY_DN244_c0_g3_i1.p1  ORF type:complete len:1021 (+),score=160.27 TRINITY_DN244_c0_g3_i1:180-3065(+)